ncbi:MAG: GDP-4-dehydro-6-deoxy-D-mannose reductase [Candidatus Krumholzibacteriia bacterium]|jgi:GDP-4-dehydro-6-deoxy-D-mannose reductase
MPKNQQHAALITGALGFVGQNLAYDLLRSGQEVIGLGKQNDLANLPQEIGPFTLLGPDNSDPAAFVYKSDAGTMLYYPLSLEDETAVKELLGKLDVQIIYHLAAQSSAAVSFREPSATFASNLQGTLSILEALRGMPEDRRPVLLSVGSCEEYGSHPPNEMPLDEESRRRPLSPYGVSKASQTMLCQQYVISYGLPVVITRSFSHTGQGHDKRFAFPSFAAQIAAAEAGKGPQEIKTGDLSAVRDFLDVQDVLSAYRLLGEKGVAGEIYNVSSSKSLTIQQGLEILVGGARCEITLRKDPDRCRPSDIPYMVGDNTKLKETTGWSPQHDFTDTLMGLLDEARKEYQ